MKPAILLLLAYALALPAAATTLDHDRLADAIWHAEGGAKARKPYGVLSVPVRNAAEARRVVLTSIRNNLARWESAGRPGSFIDFMADRWCPPRLDPAGNRNWKRNVPQLYRAIPARRTR